MNKEDWDERCSRGIFALVLAILVFAPLAFGGVKPWAFLVIQGLTLGVMVLWAVRLWVSPKPQFLWPPLAWAVLAFALYAVGRYLNSDIEYVARHEFIKVLVFTFLFFAILNNLYHQEMTQTISYTLIFVAMAMSSYAVVQYVTHSNRVWNLTAEYPGRATGTFLSPDHFCAFLEMILPMVLSIILAGRVKPLTRILLAYSFVVITAGISVTFSRGGWASTLVGLLVVLLILVGHRNHRKFAGIVLLVLIGGGTFFVTRFLSHSLTYMQRVANAEGQVNLDIFVRLRMWKAAVQMWLDHFWWGVGPGLFDYRFNEYRPQTLQLSPGWVHGDYLNLLTDWGTVGGLIVLTGMVLLVAGIFRTWQRVRRSESDFGSHFSNRFAFFIGCLGGLAALGLHSVADFSMHFPADALLALTLLALLSSTLRFATERYWHKIRLPVKITTTFVLAAGLAFLGWQEFRLGQESFWLARADKIPEPAVPRAEILQQAFRCEPMNFENALAIGECYRVATVAGTTNAEALGNTAMHWYKTSQKLNSYNYASYLCQGICLDLAGQHEEAGKAFAEADTRNPNDNYTTAYNGWHYLQIGNITAAHIWLIRSLELKPISNLVASACLPVVELEISEQAGNFQ